MKYIKILLTALLFQLVISNVFAQGWSNWTQWINLQNRLNISMSVSFKFFGDKCDFANGRYRIQNNSYYPEGSTATVAFKFFDCNGNQQDMYQVVYLNQTGLFENNGYSFDTSSHEVKDVRLNEVYIPSKKIWYKLVDGAVVDIWKQRYGNN